MAFSRRKFMQRAASSSALALAVPGTAELLPLLNKQAIKGFRPALLPSQKEAWDWQVWMAKLGPKYTGNPAHTQYVEFLATKLQSFGLDLTRDRYTLPRWDARRWEIKVHPVSGASFNVPVTSYYPYSGQTPSAGVTGELVHLGTFSSLGLAPNRDSGRQRAAGGAGRAPAPTPTPELPKDVRGKSCALTVPFCPSVSGMVQCVGR